MGLDISVYSKATLTPPHERSDDCWDGQHVVAMVYEGMEQSARGLMLTDDITKGIHWGRCYDVSDAESFGFRAGSYSGYGRFREDLCTAALDVPLTEVWENPLSYYDKPFFEIFNFADNEGTIGPEAAQDLYDDFVAQRDKVLDAWAAQYDARNLSYYVEKYEDWTKAFDMARLHGIVVFH